MSSLWRNLFLIQITQRKIKSTVETVWTVDCFVKPPNEWLFPNLIPAAVVLVYAWCLRCKTLCEWALIQIVVCLCFILFCSVSKREWLPESDKKIVCSGLIFSHGKAQPSVLDLVIWMHEHCTCVSKKLGSTDNGSKPSWCKQTNKATCEALKQLKAEESKLIFYSG